MAGQRHRASAWLLQTDRAALPRCRALTQSRMCMRWSPRCRDRLAEDTAGDTESTVQVVNPLAGLTKGEVCKVGRDAGLTMSDLESTLSCGKPLTRRSGGPPTANCGVCFPCLVRRSGLLHANSADHTRHEALPWADDLPLHRGADWRALQMWLLGRYALTDVLTDTPWPPDMDPVVAFDSIRRGREELERLLPIAAVAEAADVA
ncbi:7-cyano-7-deazaguanine synthase [Streptomyces sp. NPDC053069]|uniref:7-cyano-7-deazaguanine synthase n=1 Tax=Streptomyces sp. NPDC053069 TaxID=3365695 RepID=UPI0037D5FBD5